MIISCKQWCYRYSVDADLTGILLSLPWKKFGRTFFLQKSVLIGLNFIQQTFRVVVGSSCRRFLQPKNSKIVQRHPAHLQSVLVLLSSVKLLSKIRDAKSFNFPTLSGQERRVFLKRPQPHIFLSGSCQEKCATGILRGTNALAACQPWWASNHMVELFHYYYPI